MMTAPYANNVASGGGKGPDDSSRKPVETPSKLSRRRPWLTGSRKLVMMPRISKLLLVLVVVTALFFCSSFDPNVLKQYPASRSSALNGDVVNGTWNLPEEIRIISRIVPYEDEAIRGFRMNISNRCIQVLQVASKLPGASPDPFNDSRLAKCRKKLCFAMQQLASQASKRAAIAVQNDYLTESVATITTDQNGLLPGSSESSMEGTSQRADPDPGFLCSSGWKRGLMSRISDNRFLRRAFTSHRTSPLNVSARIDSLCARVHEIERNLTKGLDEGGANNSSSNSSSLNAQDGPCSQWPESCWPVPGMPFSKLSQFGQRKYLVFAAVEEQLTNAKIHVIEAARIAKESNRILVLPKAGHSHLSVGRGMPLCAYCDLAHLNTTEWVSPEFFLLIARAAFSRPSVGFLCVDTPALGRRCFGTKEMAVSLEAVLTLALGHAPSEGNTVHLHMPARPDHVRSLLKAWGDKDVVIYSKNTFDRFDKGTDDLAHNILPYARELHTMARGLLAQLPKDFIAVHFRSEFIAYFVAEERKPGLTPASRLEVVKKRMAYCTTKAEQIINHIKEVYNISTVFIAADIPFNESATARSESWGAMAWAYGSSNLTKVPHYWLSWLRSKVTGTVMIDELMPSLNSLDPGVVAILDKLISAHAPVFLVGSEACGGARNFEKDIRDHRRNIIGSDDGVYRWAKT